MSLPKAKPKQGVDPALRPFLDEVARLLAAAELRDAEARRALREATAKAQGRRR